MRGSFAGWAVIMALSLCQRCYAFVNRFAATAIPSLRTSCRNSVPPSRVNSARRPGRVHGARERALFFKGAVGPVDFERAGAPGHEVGAGCEGFFPRVEIVHRQATVVGGEFP